MDIFVEKLVEYKYQINPQVFDKILFHVLCIQSVQETNVNKKWHVEQLIDCSKKCLNNNILCIINDVLLHYLDITDVNNLEHLFKSMKL